MIVMFIWACFLCVLVGFICGGYYVLHLTEDDYVDAIEEAYIAAEETARIEYETKYDNDWK